MAFRITITSFAAIIVLFLGMLSHVESFTVRPLPSSAATSRSSLRMTTLVYNGKKKDFKPGSPLSKAMAQLGVPVKYSCKKWVPKNLSTEKHVDREDNCRMFLTEMILIFLFICVCLIAEEIVPLVKWQLRVVICALAPAKYPTNRNSNLYRKKDSKSEFKT